MRSETVLIADDAPEITSVLSHILNSKGFAVEIANNGQEAIDKIGEQFFDLVLTDLSMPKKDGIEVLRHIKEHSPDTICIIITGFGTVESAVEALRIGAFDYLTKPVKPDEILVVIDKALEVRELRRENISLREKLNTIQGFRRIIGNSLPMQEVFRFVEKVANTESTVLITGESGTGKELIAQAIHQASDRKDQSFVPVNCAAIPADILESELFGHEKGAFTHAIKTRKGKFEMADKGTIFLDEIGEMSPPLQVKLLRVLQERAFERVGGTKTIQVDIRIIAATNRDLEEAVRQGQFREDLFYRLNVIPIHVPPLRERASDIPLLVKHFLDKLCANEKICIKGIDNAALDRLTAYHWPGNVRELENIIERMAILAGGPVITTADLPEWIAKTGDEGLTRPLDTLGVLPEEGLSLSGAVERFEKNLILQALERTDWVKNRAAKLLRMNRTTLVEKMKKQNLVNLKQTDKPQESQTR